MPCISLDMTVAKINIKWKWSPPQHAFSLLLHIRPCSSLHTHTHSYCYCILPHHCYCILNTHTHSRHCYCIYGRAGHWTHFRVKLTAESALLTVCRRRRHSTFCLCMTFIWLQSTKYKYLSCGWTLSLLLLAMSSSFNTKCPYIEMLWYESVHCQFPGVKQIIKI